MEAFFGASGRSYGQLTLAADENRCKGLCLAPVVAQAEQLCWQAFQAELEREDADLAALVRHGGIVGGGWYPISWYRTVHTCLVRTSGLGLALCRRLGRESVERDLTSGVFRVITRFSSPQLVLSKGAWLLSRYIDKATVTTERVGENAARAKFSHCPGFSQAIWEDLAGGCEACLIVAGAEHVVVQIVEGGRDHQDYATLKANWR